MNNMIEKEFEGKWFQFREDGYFNMTKAAKMFRRDLAEWKRLPNTINYINELENMGFSHLLDTNRGRNGGTWGHPKLAVYFARWLDVRFSIWCDGVIEDIIRGNPIKIEMTEEELIWKAITLVNRKIKDLESKRDLLQSFIQ